MPVLRTLLPLTKSVGPLFVAVPAAPAAHQSASIAAPPKVKPQWHGKQLQTVNVVRACLLVVAHPGTHYHC